MTAEILGLLSGLAGLGALISALVNVLKVFNVVRDGTAPQWINGFNLVAFIIVAIVYFTNVQVDWNWVDGILVFATTFLGFVIQLFATQGTYSVIKGIPLIGYSHSEH